MSPTTAALSSVDWDAVSGISGAVAAVAAAVATGLALRTLRLGQESQRVDKQSHYFDATVFNPSKDNILAFRRAVEEHLQNLSKDLISLRGTGTRARTNLANQAITLFNDEFYVLNNGIMANADAWPDSDLALSLRIALEALQDDVTQAIDKLSRQEDAPEPWTLVRAGTSRLTELLVGADPVIRQHSVKGGNSILQQILETYRIVRWHV